METITFRKLNDDVHAPRHNPFRVDKTTACLMGPDWEIRTGLSLDLPDGYSLRVRAMHVERSYVLHWRLETGTLELILLVRCSEEVPDKFLVWVVEENLKEVRFGDITTTDIFESGEPDA